MNHDKFITTQAMCRHMSRYVRTTRVSSIKSKSYIHLCHGVQELAPQLLTTYLSLCDLDQQ